MLKNTGSRNEGELARVGGLEPWFEKNTSCQINESWVVYCRTKYEIMSQSSGFCCPFGDTLEI